MFERFSRSWMLVKASASVLQQDKSLLLFPLVSTVAALMVAATFLVPLAMSSTLQQAMGGDGDMPLWFWIGLFVFYVVQYFVMFFFNTALVAAAMIRLNGGQPSIQAGLQAAWERVGAIFTYAVIAATVGLVLRFIEQRAGMVGRWVVGFIGMAWTVASFMVVPILVTRDVGAVDAVKESVGLLKRTWGENLIGQGGVGLVFGLIQFALVMLALLLVIGAAAVGGWPLAVLVGVVFFACVILAALVQAALTGIYSAVLFRHATGQNNPAAFGDGVLDGAFQAKA